MTAYPQTLDNLYRPGLQDRNEAVISAHFMHKQNLRDEWKLYSGEEYKSRALAIGADDLSEIIDSFPAQIDQVVENRLTRAIASVQRNWRDYEMKAPNKFGAAELITEIVLDRGFRKGPIENINKTYLYDQIKKSVSAGQPVNLVVPLLPNKVDTPLKTNGSDPDFAEINLLCRLGEIAGAVTAAYERYAPGKVPEQSATFTILADGHRFQSALNVGEDKVNRYQASIKWWISRLGMEDVIHFRDYEAAVKDSLEPSLYARRMRLIEDARFIYRHAMSPVFDKADIQGSLERAISADPYPDEENPEARFVPLFKSILYTYESDRFKELCERQGYDYEGLYREITRHAFEPFAELNDEQSIEIVNSLGKESAPLTDEMKEFFRRELLKTSWDATIEYLAVVKGDRDLLNDPVSFIYPDHIRYTIHSKKGQIGLNTTGARGGELVQAWHGVAYLRPRKNGDIQIDNASRLMSEGENFMPVVVDAQDKGFPDVLSHMGQTGQALFYVHNQLPVNNVGDLKNLIQARMTRLVFDH